MRVLNVIDNITKPTIEFVWKILGAFGACWGTFSSVDVTRQQFFGYTDNDSLMDNPVYAKTALGVSIAAAGIATYVVLREKLGARNQHVSAMDEELEDVTVRIPLCHSPDITPQAKHSSLLTNDTPSSTTSVENSCAISDSSTEVVCKKKL